MVLNDRGSRSAFNLLAGEAMAAIEQIANRELPNGCSVHLAQLAVLTKAVKKLRKPAFRCASFA
jgi:hypothetical protein